MIFNEEHKLETFKSLISISTEALKALQWLNGGAVVVLLAYVGKRPEFAVHAKYSLWWFLFGLVAATVAFFTSYLTQLALYNESLHREKYKGPRHEIGLWVTFVIAVASVAAFAFGAFAGISALAQ